VILIFRIFYFDRNIVEVTMKLISILNRSLKKRKIRDKDILNSVVYYHIQEKAFSVIHISLDPSFLRTVLILSPLVDMICQEPLFTHSWMSARAIKLFVVLLREKRILRSTTKNAFYSFARQIRELAPADFPFFSSMFK